MTDSTGAIVAVVVSTLLLLALLGVSVLLLVIVHNRRTRHRAELAELHLQREQEVIRAEREATEHTMGDIGRELHDNVGQLLTLGQMGIAAVIDQGGADPRLHASMATIDEGIEEVRRLGRSLNSDTWQHRTLEDAISTEASRIERIAQVRVHLRRQGDTAVLKPEAKTILYRAFQEITSNALRHAKADRIDIGLDAGPPFHVTIKDNGRGFSATDGTGSGLANVRRRCALIGFTANMESTPGNGCTWTITENTPHAT
jgi:two-component system NarL family sensor kinase